MTTSRQSASNPHSRPSGRCGVGIDLSFGDFWPGDAILFAGTDWTSTLIKLGTCPPIYWPLFQAIVSPYDCDDCRHWRFISHFGICFDWHSRVLLGESTTLATERCEITGRRFSGVQAHDPTTRINAYPGAVWRMRLKPSWRLQPSERDELAKFMAHQVGQSYDMLGAVRSITRFPKTYRENNRFCSDLGDDGLQRVGRMPIGKSKRYSPSSLARDLSEFGKYERPIRIK